VEILAKRKAAFSCKKKSDQRKLLYLFRKIAFVEQDYNGKREIASEKLEQILFLE
jgi:hypothetical protein